MRRANFKAIDDLANVAGGMMNIATSLRTQIRNEIKSRMDDRIADMDMVPREDFEALEARVKALEEQIKSKNK